MANPFAKDGEPKLLWANYRTSLLSSLQRVNDARLPDDGKPRPVDSRIADLLKNESNDSWERLFEAEQRLIPFLSVAEVEADFARRYREAVQFGVVSADDLKAVFDKAGPGSAERSAALLTLVEDIQFRYAKRRLDRGERHRKIFMFNLVGICFVLLFLLLIFNAYGGYVSLHSQLQLTLVIGTMGAIGAYFSRSIELQRSESALDYDQIMQTYSYRTLVLRIIIGIIAAVVVYIMIAAGLFSTVFAKEMVPDLTKIDADVSKGAGFLTHPSADMAKLLVWSFFAGFSERLVARALSKVDAVELPGQNAQLLSGGEQGTPVAEPKPPSGGAQG